MNSFKIIVPFYNAEKYIERCLMSALTQKYTDFKVVCINDASTDNSNKLVLEIAKLFPDKLIYVNNPDRMGAMHNHQSAIYNHVNPEDIVVHLDGDDYLAHRKVLTYIDDLYKSSGCELMYGQYKREDGSIGTSKPFNSEEHFKNLRSLPFVFSHIRTFKGKLFHEIKKQDPDLNCFKDNNGNWLDVSCDVAMMTPLLEIAGYSKIKFNDVPLYIYNDSNPISDFRTKLAKQEAVERYVRSQKPFKKLK